MAKKDSAQSNQALTDFEKSLAELEALVEELETGEISLETSLRKFERGVTLARACQSALKQAELRVEQLTENDGKESITDFEDSEPE